MYYDPWADDPVGTASDIYPEPFRAIDALCRPGGLLDDLAELMARIEDQCARIGVYPRDGEIDALDALEDISEALYADRPHPLRRRVQFTRANIRALDKRWSDTLAEQIRGEQ